MTDNLKVEKMLEEAAGERAIQAFQLTDEYNGVLLTWYFNGFELLHELFQKKFTLVFFFFWFPRLF